MSRPDAMARHELVVAANWLPVGERHGARGWRERAGSAAPALRTAVAAHDGAWIGCATTGDPTEDLSLFEDVWLHPIPLSQREVADFHDGHCGSTLAPLYHDCGEPPQFRAHWRAAYREVNHRFAAAAARLAEPEGVVWVHDYHLQLVPGYLRRLRPDVSIGFFLHSPFPSTDRFLRQPMRSQIMSGVLGADLVGFQHGRSAKSFMELARDLSGLRCGEDTIHVGGRQVVVGTFPTSVDAAQIGRLAVDPDVRARAGAIRATLGEPRVILLSVGALDHAEGVERRLEAYAQLLAEDRLNPLDTVLVHVAACGDDDRTHDQRQRDRVDRQVAQINGTYSRVGHPVIHYLHHELDRSELVALYAAADILVATPLRHDMTLAAKEFVAAHADDTGRLVLSEFSGAVSDLPEALVVNPYDTEAVKDAILTAAGQCRTPSEAMHSMRCRLYRHDADQWAEGYLAALTGTKTARRHRHQSSGMVA